MEKKDKFWKNVGLIGTFFFGCYFIYSASVLLFFGAGFMGAINLAVGLALGWFSMAEIFSQRRNDKE